MGKPRIDVKACERLEGDDFYLVSGDCIVAYRDGKPVTLEGAEKERVRRWLFRDHLGDTPEGAPPTRGERDE